MSDYKGNKFNVCNICGCQLMVVKSIRYETCRIRFYRCHNCNRLKKSVEVFKEVTEVCKRKRPRAFYP